MRNYLKCLVQKGMLKLEYHIAGKWLELKFGGFGNSIALRKYARTKYWQTLIWRLNERTTKPPNLIPHQISGYTVFQLV